jgi:hypothetical protein
VPIPYAAAWKRFEGIDQRHGLQVFGSLKVRAILYIAAMPETLLLIPKLRNTFGSFSGIIMRRDALKLLHDFFVSRQ